MYLLIDKKTKTILLSSARPLDPEQYSPDKTYIVEISDEQYTPDMVGGILND